LIPQCLFKYLKLPVVSYAIPALIAVGFARRSMTASNRIIRRFYGTIINILLQKLCRMQPSNGGFLEAAPLTGFVAVCLSVAGYGNHAVVSRAISFLANTARTDGSWAIDTDLTIWLTSNAVRSISSLSVMTENDKLKLGEQFRDFQFKTTHPFTLSAPGGWAWTNLPGGVPDADDTSSVLNALAILQPERCDSSIENGLRWLLNMQNSDGGIPTFCRGWGFLPFDRSSPDISVHTLIAFYNWRKWLKSRLAIKIDCACVKIIRYLERVQNNDGSWNPLWFGDQNSAGQHNPVYGTGIVVDILTAIGYEGESLNRGVNYLCVSQNSDGGWGGALGTKSNIECTAIAATALCSFPNCRNNVAAACALLCDAVIESAENIPPASPIGLYFAALWYDEKLYPLLFVVRFFNKYLTVIHH
jgi:squalene-hopene/tetraprenyl-beta-curcumene cyclase